MAITGVRSMGAQTEVPVSLERIVEASVDLLGLFDLVEDASELRDSLVREYRRLKLLGPGRLFVALPASVPTSLMVTILNESAIDQEIDGVDCLPELLEVAEVGVPLRPSARLALYSTSESSAADKLLHYTQWPLDRTLQSLSSQRILLRSDQDYLERTTPSAVVYAATLRDAIVWALLDILQGEPVDRLSLDVGSIMRLLSHATPVELVRESDVFYSVRRGNGEADPMAGIGVTISYRD